LPAQGRWWWWASWG